MKTDRELIDDARKNLAAKAKCLEWFLKNWGEPAVIEFLDKCDTQERAGKLNVSPKQYNALKKMAGLWVGSGRGGTYKPKASAPVTPPVALTGSGASPEEKYEAFKDAGAYTLDALLEAALHDDIVWEFMRAVYATKKTIAVTTAGYGELKFPFNSTFIHTDNNGPLSTESTKRPKEEFTLGFFTEVFFMCEKTESTVMKEKILPRLQALLQVIQEHKDAFQEE